MKLKIMTYNILTGFHDIDNGFKLDFNRINAAQKIIKGEKPDILILNEAYFSSENKFGVFVDYQKLFGFPHYSQTGHKEILNRGNVVLSNYPIVTSKNLSRELNSFLRVKVKLGKKLINIDVIHMPPVFFMGSDERKKFLEKVLKTKKSNYILTGDFNALSPEDSYNKEKMVKAWFRFTENHREVVNEMLQAKEIKFVLSNGLIDTYKEKNKKSDFTVPTDFLSKKKDSGVRLDYIFCSKDFKVMESKIIKNKLAEKASDHYPIVAVLELK